MIELTAEQNSIIQEALYWFMNSSEQIFEISGCAGTGKSVVLGEIVRRLNLRSDQYIAAAYTGAAAIVMRTKGFRDARSLHSVFYKCIPIGKYDFIDFDDEINTTFNTPKRRFKFVPLDVGDLDSRIRLIVIDEAFMVPDYMKINIMKHGIKILASGDVNQLPPVSGNPAFFRGNIPIHYLTQIMRQNANNAILYIALRILNDKPIHCGVFGNVTVIEDKDLTSDMLYHVGNVICYSNNTRDMFNHNIRVLHGKQSIAPEYGDRVICRHNNWDIDFNNLSLANGLLGTIVSPITPESLCNNSKDKKNYGTFKMDFLPDLIQVPFRNIHANYEYIVSPYKRREEIKSSKHYNGELFEYAYAITAHVSQGSEYSSGIFYEEPCRPEQAKAVEYTAVTRFKERLIYVKKCKKYY